jgi:tRNA-uridine 2-sulfurtransferase
VLRPVWQEYARGRTPNPCVLCNHRVKFGLLMRKAQELGAEKIATGHYARLEFSKNGHPVLQRGADRNKDQSYFLARLDSTQLRHTIFPLGQLEKPKVRELARQFGLVTADQPDSQDACLATPGECFAEMLRKRFEAQVPAGIIVDTSGQEFQKHTGIHQFTIGQRKGLKLPTPNRAWVKAIDPKTSTVTVTQQEIELFSKGMMVSNMRWFETPDSGKPQDCQVQVRYRQEPMPSRIESIESDTVRVTFQKAIRAVTPGQAAVFYDGDRVLGSGWIDAAFGSSIP